MLLRVFGGWWKLLVLGEGEGEGGMIGGRSSLGLGFDFDFGSGGIPVEGWIGFLPPSAG